MGGVAPPPKSKPAAAPPIPAASCMLANEAGDERELGGRACPAAKSAATPPMLLLRAAASGRCCPAHIPSPLPPPARGERPNGFGVACPAAPPLGLGLGVEPLPTACRAEEKEGVRPSTKPAARCPNGGYSPKSLGRGGSARPAGPAGPPHGPRCSGARLACADRDEARYCPGAASNSAQRMASSAVASSALRTGGSKTGSCSTTSQSSVREAALAPSAVVCVASCRTPPRAVPPPARSCSWCRWTVGGCCSHPTYFTVMRTSSAEETHAVVREYSYGPGACTVTPDAATPSCTSKTTPSIADVPSVSVCSQQRQCTFFCFLSSGVTSCPTDRTRE